MTERVVFWSNGLGFLATGAIVAFVLSLPPGSPASQGAPATVEITLDELAPSPPPPDPEPVQTAPPPPPAPPVAEPPPVQPEPPPPPPPPVKQPEEQKAPDPELPKPETILRDDEGQKVQQAPMQELDPQAAARIKAHLAQIAKYPAASTRKLTVKPRGRVGLAITIVDGKVQAVEVVQSSGSSILDQAAKSIALASDMSFVGPGSFKFTGAIQY